MQCVLLRKNNIHNSAKWPRLVMPTEWPAIRHFEQDDGRVGERQIGLLSFNDLDIPMHSPFRH